MARVTPTNVRGVLVVAVLRVVEQDVGTLRDLVTADPVRRHLLQRDSDRWFVIGHVREHVAVLLDAIADRRALVRDGRSVDHRRSDLDVLRFVVEHDVGRKIGEMDREQRRRQVSRDALFESTAPATPDPTGAPRCRVEQRPEEAETLQVVEVKVRQQDVDLASVGAVDRDAERAHAGAGVEDELVTALQLDLHAARVPAVAHRVGPGRRERTTTTPHASRIRVSVALVQRPEHRDDTVQLLLRADKGYEVASTSRRVPSNAVHRTRRCAGRRWKNAMPAGESAPDIGVLVRVRRDRSARRIRTGELTQLGHRTADQQLGRIVAVDEHAFAIEQEHRCRQVRSELTRQDQRQALRRHRRRLHTATLLTGRGRATGPTRPNRRETGMATGGAGSTVAAVQNPDDSAGSASVLIAALRDLQWRRRRFLIAVIGTSVVFAMTLILTGLSHGFDVEAARHRRCARCRCLARSGGRDRAVPRSCAVPGGTGPRRDRGNSTA